MIGTGTLALRGVRTNALEVSILWEGLDLTGADLEAVVLQNWDNDPASPEITLADGVAAGETGLTLGTVTTVDGLAQSEVTLLIDAADMAAIPQAAEIGTDLQWVWYLNITPAGGVKERYLEGAFLIGGSASGRGSIGQVNATVANQMVTVEIEGAGVVAGYTAAAKSAAAQAQNSAAQLSQSLDTLAVPVDQHPVPVASKFINAATGVAQSSTSYSYAIVDIPEGVRGAAVSTATLSTSVYGIVYLDGSNAVVGKELQGSGAFVYHQDYEATIPPTATKMAINSRNSQPILCSLLLIADDVAKTAKGLDGVDATLREFVPESDYPTTAQYITSAGIKVANNAYQLAEIPLSQAEAGVRVTAKVSGGSAALARFVDATGTVISSVPTGVYNDFVLYDEYNLPPEGAAKVYITANANSDLVIETKQRAKNVAQRVASLEGPPLRIGFFGNSQVFNYKWQPACLRAAQATQSFNAGYSGEDFGYLADTAMADIDLSATDVLLIKEFDNEYGSAHRPPGTIDDPATADTTCGKMRSIIEQAYDKKRDIRIVFMGLTYKGYADNGGGTVRPPNTEPNDQGVTGKQLNDLGKAFCEKLGIPFVDLWTISGINAYTDENNETATGTLTYTGEGLHWNEKGGPAIGWITGRFVRDTCYVKLAA